MFTLCNDMVSIEYASTEVVLIHTIVLLLSSCFLVSRKLTLSLLYVVS